MRMLLLLMLVALAASVRVSDESGGCTVRSPSTCRATQDYVIVADNSWSVEDSFQTISNLMKGFIAGFDMDVNDPESPRVGCFPCPALHTPVTIVWLLPMSHTGARLQNARASFPLLCYYCLQQLTRERVLQDCHLQRAGGRNGGCFDVQLRVRHSNRSSVVKRLAGGGMMWRPRRPRRPRLPACQYGFEGSQRPRPARLEQRNY